MLAAELKALGELTLTGLMNARKDRSRLSPAAGAYLEVLIADERHDARSLRQAVESLPLAELSPENRLLRLCGELRIQILENKIKPRAIRALRDLAESLPLMQAEAYLVIGQALAHEGDAAAAQEFFHRAWAAADETGCPRRAVQALFRVVGMEARLKPEKKLVADYHFVMKRALKAKLPPVVGSSLLYISAEYESIGALDVALKYCNRALVFLEQELGGAAYYQALVHRCRLLTRLGRQQEAELDHQRARICDIPKVREALEALSRTAGPQAKAVKFSDLENRLLHFISRQPRDKFEIIEHLYGTRVNFTLAENRLKVLINRVRKKQPSLVVFENGKYRVSDQVFVAVSVRRSA